MKRASIWWLLVVVCCLGEYQYANADTKISALPAGGALVGTEPIPTVQTATTVATTPAAINTYVKANGTQGVANGGTGVVTISGLIKGNGTSAFSAAVSSDVRALFSGTCDATTFLRGDGACAQASLTTNVSGTLPVANGGTNLTAATDDNVAVGNGTTWQSKALPAACATTSSALAYDTTTNTFSCNTVGALASGTFTATYTAGFTSTPTQTFAWTKAGNQCTVRMTGTTTGTSNANTFSTAAAALPAACRPAGFTSTYNAIGLVQGAAAAKGCIGFLADGTIQYGTVDSSDSCFLSAASSMATTGTKAIAVSNTTTQFTFATP